MPDREDIPYLEYRLSQSREQADAADDISVRIAHRKLASTYAAKLKEVRARSTTPA
ncbi:MAG: hypothetical protein JWN66_1526 [Sphingomonas bacterium]|jgi:hypothetical protein|uniref:hypothetical protein n=1 Tax=Sphingomonas bacterium TaxID=1895847 RepID=UPI002623855D|nr:hypothetical protein [Sphingomonas bacterium]MDB5704410.1 hypothetical protein [Sphingomonas bacterium]